MERCIIYEDVNGYCRVVIPCTTFKQDWESEENAIARLSEVSIPDVAHFIVCKTDKIPKDLTFRDAWKQGTVEEPIKIDFEKALQIHRKRIQEAADKKIEQLNRQLDIAIENENLPEQVAIRRTKKILRTFENINLSHCKTVDDIKWFVPLELKDVWTHYALI